jgi:WD40 repeat protein
VPAAPAFQYDVFLSHNARDKARVRRLAERLKAAGLRVWFDEWVIKPGDDIYLAIERGLEAAAVQVLCLSPAALGSEWVTLERATVLFRDPTNAGRRFIPLLLADCELPDTLRRYKYVDFRKQTQAALDELLAVCRIEAEGVSRAPSAEPAKKPDGKAAKKPGKTPTKKKPLPEKKAEHAEPPAALERELRGRAGWVTSVAVSPDGTWAASGSRDGKVRIWELETGLRRATLSGHWDEVRSVAITPDGKRILSAAKDSSIRVWHSGSGREQVTLDDHTGVVWSVVALPDDAHALSGGWDNTLRLWDLASGTCVKTLSCGMDLDNNIFGSDVNRAATQVLSGHRDGRIRLWDLDTGHCLATLKGHSEIVSSVQITPDGRFAVSGSTDTTVKKWDLEAESCIGTLEGHGKAVESVAASPDGATIASTGLTDGTARLWDWNSSECLHVIEYEEIRSPNAVAFSPDGSRLVVGTVEGAIYVYRFTGARAADRSRRGAAT